MNSKYEIAHNEIFPSRNPPPPLQVVWGLPPVVLSC